MKRQTNLCLEDICAYLEQSRLTGGCGACHGGTLPYPPCLLVNELGIFAINEANKEAEAKLRDILDWPQEDLRAIAYLMLYLLPGATQATIDAMRAFSSRPKNVVILNWVDKEIKSRRGAN